MAFPQRKVEMFDTVLIKQITESSDLLTISNRVLVAYTWCRDHMTQLTTGNIKITRVDGATVRYMVILGSKEEALQALMEATEFGRLLVEAQGQKDAGRYYRHRCGRLSDLWDQSDLAQFAYASKLQLIKPLVAIGHNDTGYILRQHNRRIRSNVKRGVL